MSMLSKVGKLSLIVSRPHIITCQTRYLFILSHMRSRSSVVSHVLGSNRDVCGYSELHRSYSSRLDLLKMRGEIYQEARCKLNNKYLLDKLLHDYCFISDEIFEVAKPKVIFLLREPESTLKSIINMGQRTGVEWYKDLRAVANYYCARLASLETYAGKIAGNYFFIDADDVVTKTDTVLAQLTEWLELEEPLDRHYSRFRNTGKRHRGDSSENIQSGIIKRTTGHPELCIPADTLRRAQAAFQHCKRYLGPAQN
jgi:hypothetical protein